MARTKKRAQQNHKEDGTAAGEGKECRKKKFMLAGRNGQVPVLACAVYRNNTYRTMRIQ
jgi:hypothetical protein